MMKGFVFVGFMVAVGLFAGCGGGAANADAVPANAETTAKIEKAVAAAPTKGSLLELETKALEAWKKGDAAFWKEYYADDYVSFIGGTRVDKAGIIKRITETKCEVASYSLSDEKMTPVGNDAIALTVKVTIDGTCGGQKLPSPVMSASLYVRNGDKWRSAYHNDVVVLDPAAAQKPASPKAAAPKKPAARQAEAPKSEAFTGELFAVETKVWDAWKARDRAAMEHLLTEDLTLVDGTGTVTVGRNAVVDAWILPKCDIKTAAPSDGIATQISPVIGILTFKGNATGTCEGPPLESFWGTSIFLKEAGEWKIVYTFENPAA
ncbi:MAG: nuclear transport factor 2 family protein [Pyrinomonadaceae bacterium]